MARHYRNHDADRQRHVRALLAKVPEYDRLLIGGERVAAWLNGHGWRTWRKNHLVNAHCVRRWAVKGRLPATRGLGGCRGRPLVTSQFALVAWLHGPQRCVRLDRTVCSRERGERPRAAP